jgi:RND family efflux transporter MFP subunit
MNRQRLSLLLLAVVCGLAAVLFWRRAAPTGTSDNEEKVVTEVAVHVGNITRATVHAYVAAYGMVEAEPAGLGKPAASVHVASPVAGVIAAANAVEGQHVEKGVELFRLDSRVADVAVEKAKIAVEFAANTLERQRNLLKVDGASQRQVQEAQQQLDAAGKDLAQAQTQRSLQTVTAPLTGTVVRVNVKRGETVDPTTVLAEVIDLDRLVVSANIPSAELPGLSIGQPVELPALRPTQTAQPEHAAAPLGTLTFIGWQVDPKTGTAPARISIPAGTGLRPGQFVSARVITEQRHDRLTVPIESVVRADGGSVIAVVDGDIARQRPVTVGLREGNLVEIEGDALQEGMIVVTEGAYGLPKETKVRVVDHAQ